MGLKIFGAIVLFPALWIAIAFNFGGIADRLSFLPGVSSDGGLMSGLSAVLITLVVLGAVVGGVTAMGLPISGGDDDSPTRPSKSEITATSTENQRAPSTATPTLTSTPTPTPSPAEIRQQELTTFKADYRSRVNATFRNKSVTDVPVLATEYRETDDGKLELWMVFWECDGGEQHTDQLLTISYTYVGAVGEHKGAKPDRLRVYGVSNLVNFPNRTAFISTSSAQAAGNGSMSPESYTQEWWERQRIPTQSENETAYQMIVEDSGREKANQAFYNDHREIRGCPGAAEAGTG